MAHGKGITSALITALLVGIIGGVLALLLGPVLMPLTANALVGGFLLLLIGVVILWLRKANKLDDLDFVGWIVLFLFVVAITSILGAFIPAVSGFLLSIGNFTVGGLAFTILYVLLAERVLHMVGYKVEF